MDTKHIVHEFKPMTISGICSYSSIFKESIYNNNNSGYRLSLEVDDCGGVDILLNHGIHRTLKGRYKNSRMDKDGRIYYSMTNKNAFPIYDTKGRNMRGKNTNLSAMDKYFNGATISVEIVVIAVNNPQFGKRIFIRIESVSMIEKPSVGFELL